MSTGLPRSVSVSSPVWAGNCSASGWLAQAKSPVTRCSPTGTCTRGASSWSEITAATPSMRTSWGQLFTSPGSGTQPPRASKMRHCCSKVPDLSPTWIVSREGQRQLVATSAPSPSELAPARKGQRQASAPCSTHGTQGSSCLGISFAGSTGRPTGAAMARQNAVLQQSRAKAVAVFVGIEPSVGCEP